MLTRLLLVVLPALTVACSCNGKTAADFDFPEVRQAQTEAPPDFGSWLSMGVAPDGARLTITYYDRVTTGIGFAVGTPAADGTVSWLHEAVDGYPADGFDPGVRGRYTSHMVTPEGIVWASYQDVDNLTLKVARRMGTSNWESEVADAGGGLTSSGAGFWTSIGLLADGRPIVAHHDEATDALRVAWKTDSGWSTEEVTRGAAGPAGQYADLLVDGDTVHIAYYNGVNGNLEVASGSPGSWTIAEVDTPGNVGQWPSLAMSEGSLMVAYHHVGDQDLKFATRTAGSWTTEIVDDGDYRGADTKLLIVDGEPAIIYFDGDLNDQRLATRVAGTWTTRLLSGDGGATGFHNEAVLMGGQLWAGSYNFTTRGLTTVLAE